MTVAWLKTRWLEEYAPAQKGEKAELLRRYPDLPDYRGGFAVAVEQADTCLVKVVSADARAVQALSDTAEQMGATRSRWRPEDYYIRVEAQAEVRDAG